MATIALLTDFGRQDHYVGVLHSVLAQAAPGVDRIDLGHEVDPGDVWGGCFLLRCSRPWLPPDAVIVAVVDPEVGSGRRGLAVRQGRCWLVAPDNGLCAALGPVDEVVELDHERMGLPQPSATFHGRDLFAPAAGRLACGATAADLGETGDPESLVACPLPEPSSTTRSIIGSVQHVDRFGNLVTNLEANDLLVNASLRWGRGVEARRVLCYADGGSDEVVTIAGSSGYLELSVNRGSAAGLTGLGRGDRVEVDVR